MSYLRLRWFLFSDTIGKLGVGARDFGLFPNRASWFIGLEVPFARNLHLFCSVVALYPVMREVQGLILGSIHGFYSHNTDYHKGVSEGQDDDNRWPRKRVIFDPQQCCGLTVYGR